VSGIRWMLGKSGRKRNPLMHFQALLLMTVLWAATIATAESRFVLADGSTVAPLEMFQDCAECPEMIVLPMGSFTMGAPLKQSEQVYLSWYGPKPDGKPVGMEQEGPEHEVSIDIPIAMGRNEVTRAEWLACVADGGCSHVPDPKIRQRNHRYIYADDPRMPVIDVSYLDMLEYVAWLNRKTGTSAYRLPTEAEWEYAARAGTKTKYAQFAQGDILTLDNANIFIARYADGSRYVYRNPPERSYPDPNNRPMPVPVDMLDAANAWGLRHMAGNVRERTMSCSSKRHLGLSTSSAYLAKALQADSCSRVVKGGSFKDRDVFARSANRGSGYENVRSITCGFRIIKEME